MMKCRTEHQWTRWIACREGVALIEFVLVVPILILLILGCIELGRFSLIRLKVDKSAYAIGSMMSQASPAEYKWTAVGCSYDESNVGLHENEVTRAMNQFDRIMAPYNGDGKQMVILTSVTKLPVGVLVKWQMSGGGSMDTGVTSDITQQGPQGICCAGQLADVTGDTATQLNAMDTDDNIMVTEVFYRYTPILAATLQNLGFTITPATLVRRVYLGSRNGSLDYMFDTYPPPPSSPPAPHVGC